MRLAAPIRRLIPIASLAKLGTRMTKMVWKGSCGNFGWLKQKHAKKFLELNVSQCTEFHSQSGQIWCEHLRSKFKILVKGATPSISRPSAEYSLCSLHRYPTGKGIHRIRMVFHLLKPVLNCAYHEPHDVSNWSKLRKIEGSAWYHFPRFYWSTAGYHLVTKQSLTKNICDQNSLETW